MNVTPDIYVAKVENNNVMLKNTGSIYIPQGQAVILYGESNELNSQSVDPQFILTYTDGGSGLSEGNTSGNQLLGSTTAVTQDAGYTYYALGKSGTTVKFRRVGSTVNIPAYKAYLKLPAAAAPDLRIRNSLVNLTLTNRCYHDCLNCHMTFVDCIDEIVEKVTADGSKEGAIIWVSPEKNEHFDFPLSTRVAALISEVAGLEFDGTDLDRPMCVKKAVEEIKKHLYDKGLLVPFRRDLKMKDLRRKVLVLFDHPTDEGETVDWGELAGYIGIKSDNAITRADGKEVAVVHQQNDWGPDGGQSNDAFMLRKKRGFIDMLYTHAQVRDTSWIFNACNAYISDPLPNYSAYCAKLYPTYTKHLNLKRTRGIFQTDYCGMNEFTRLELSQVIAIVTAKVLISGVLDDPVTLIAIAGAFAARTPDKVMSHTLISSMIYNNFRYFR